MRIPAGVPSGNIRFREIFYGMIGGFFQSIHPLSGDLRRPPSFRLAPQPASEVAPVALSSARALPFLRRGLLRHQQICHDAIGKKPPRLRHRHAPASPRRARHRIALRHH